jgi:hypothetical protein
MAVRRGGGISGALFFGKPKKVGWPRQGMKQGMYQKQKNKNQ